MGAFLYIKSMIYTILSIPFGGAFLYFFAASRVQTSAFRNLTEEEIEEYGIEDTDAKVFDPAKAGRWLALMSVCWYLGYPIIKLHKLLSK